MKYAVDKQALLDEFKKSKNDQFKWTEKFGELLIQLHKLVLQKPNFHNYKPDFKQDMMQYSLLRLMIGLKNFDERKAIFPYLYRAIHVNFWQFCIQYYKRRNKHNKYIYDQLKLLESNNVINSEQRILLNTLNQDEYINK